MARILAEEAAYEADETHSVQPYPPDGVKLEVQLNDCDCCADKDALLGYISQMFRILLDGWATALKIKRDRDSGGRGWDQFDEGGKERALLKLFDFWDTDAGDATTDLINDITKGMDGMVSRLQSEPLKIQCEKDCGDGPAGWVLNGILFRNGKIIHLCCDTLKDGNADDIRDVLIHELSHSVLKTRHTEDDPINSAGSADVWGDLGRSRTSPFID